MKLTLHRLLLKFLLLFAIHSALPGAQAFYDARLGRWVNRDPIEEWGGANIYGFAGNEPTDKIDPFGLAYGDIWDPRTWFREPDGSALPIPPSLKKYDFENEDVPMHAGYSIEDDFNRKRGTEVLAEIPKKIGEVGASVSPIGEEDIAAQILANSIRRCKLLRKEKTAFDAFLADKAKAEKELAKRIADYGTIRNKALAGKKHPVTKIPFDKDGFPDFSSVTKKEVKIKYTGDRDKDFAAADAAAGITDRENYTWHHHQDGTTMQLVPTKIHRDTGHTGGFALWPF